MKFIQICGTYGKGKWLLLDDDFYALKYHKIFAMLNFSNFDYTNYKINKVTNRIKTSQYIGIHKHRKLNIYISKVRLENNKVKTIGYFKNKLAAVIAYDKFIINNNLNKKN